MDQKAKQQMVSGICYHSTRTQTLRATPKQAILSGLAEDGGLYVYEEIDQIKLPLKDMMEMNLCQIAERVLSALLPDFSAQEVTSCVKQAYEGYFDHEEITPLIKSGSDMILELFHGPTSAFKDVGLRMLPQLMTTALQTKKDEKVMILTATSGDTGKAALAGFQDVERIGITVFYPDHGVSEIQRLQMATQKGNNVAIAAIKGNFDDAQSKVKELFNDQELQEQLKKEHIVLSSANSINIGRLIPQVVYYFYAYQQMVKRKEITYGEEIDFCIPTGNFGNVLAGYYAKLMGLPIHRFIVACNANHVLHDFLTTGIYDRNRDFHKTISPSMDILISSNLERLLYYASGKNCGAVTKWMEELRLHGRYEVDPKTMKQIRSLFVSAYANDEECRSRMKLKYEADGYVLDPHTACGYHAMKRHQDKKHPCVLLATASPYKFCAAVHEALFGEANGDEFAIMASLEKHTGTLAPKQLKKLCDLPLLHKDVIEKDAMKEYVWKQGKRVFS